jgi:ATP-dependent RNA helicase RhlE
VVNFDLPNVPEDYVHRIGRTGRAGREGEAISLVCVDELKLLRDIERVINREIPKRVIDGFEPDASIRAEPIVNGRQPNRNQKPGQGRNKAKRGHGGNGNGNGNGKGKGNGSRQGAHNAPKAGNQRNHSRRAAA